MGYCCADCVYMDTNDENSRGEFWCGKRGKYYPGGDSTCSDFKPREDSGGCYITTAVCGSLNKSDDCYELNAFRDFRDNWLKSQPDGNSLIEEYYKIAPHIVEKIDKLPNPIEVYRSIWQKYLSPCLKFIETGDNISCKNLYSTMIENLKKAYLG